MSTNVRGGTRFSCRGAGIRASLFERVAVRSARDLQRRGCGVRIFYFRSFDFLVSGMRHCSRGAGAPEFCDGDLSSQKGREGAARRVARQSLCARLLAKAWRPPARRPAFSFGVGRALRGSPGVHLCLRRPPLAGGGTVEGSGGPDGRRQPCSWRAAHIGRRAELRRRPGAWPARHARGRRSAPHEPAQPVRVPHGNGQL